MAPVLFDRSLGVAIVGGLAQLWTGGWLAGLMWGVFLLAAITRTPR